MSDILMTRETTLSASRKKKVDKLHLEIGSIGDVPDVIVKLMEVVDHNSDIDRKGFVLDSIHRLAKATLDEDMVHVIDMLAPRLIEVVILASKNKLLINQTTSTIKKCLPCLR